MDAVRKFNPDKLQPYINELLGNLSFSHFIEFLKADSEQKCRFYEDQAMKNNWAVRDLKRAIESLLYERTGLSRDKEDVLKEHRSNTRLKLEEVFRNTYMLEFLGLEESRHTVNPT